jgi:hypothetical protein
VPKRTTHDKQLDIVGGHAGALETTRWLRLFFDDDDDSYDEWLDTLIAEGSVGEHLYYRRHSVAERVEEYAERKRVEKIS